ncbi:MAG: DUF3301 domain-containing protein [Pseudomonadales bacterium]
MEELLFIILVTVGGLYWVAAMRCKELAISTARRECNRHDVQLLDQTVHQNHISLSRDQDGRWRVWREYRFEYSENGVERRMGALIILGQRVMRISLESLNTIIH